jgi:hypothetical protein
MKESTWHIKAGSSLDICDGEKGYSWSRPVIAMNKECEMDFYGVQR